MDQAGPIGTGAPIMLGDHELLAVLDRLLREHRENTEEFVLSTFQECLAGVGASPAGARPELVYRLASQRLTAPSVP
jgi:hypothetical protein